MFQNSLVSVIMPCFNAAAFISESIESVLEQTYSNLELLIIDDGSTDHSTEIVQEKALQDKRVKLFQLDGNGGAAVARNYGIHCAQGQFIAFLDSDDLWAENKLEKQVRFMKQNQVGFTFSNYHVITEEKQIKKEVKVPQVMDYDKLLHNTIIGCLTVVIDREIIGDFEMPLIQTRQDTATWLSILRKGHLAYGIQESLAFYRIVSNSLSRKKLNMLKANWNMYRRIEKLSIFYTVECLIGYMFHAIKKKDNLGGHHAKNNSNWSWIRWSGHRSLSCRKRKSCDMY